MFSKTKLKNESINRRTESYNIDMEVIWMSEAVNPSKLGEILPKTYYVEVSFSDNKCTRHNVTAHVYCHIYPLQLQTLTHIKIIATLFSNTP
jgi:hypothetical protein